MENKVIKVNKYQESILEGMETMIRERLSGLSLNYKIEGRVEEVLPSNEYNVVVNDRPTKVKAMNSDKYVVGDVVYILVFNGNYSDKKILCKK